MTKDISSNWANRKKECLICEKPLYYIPLGQRWKVNNISPVFYHEKCVGCSND